MQHLYFVRHAQSRANALRILASNLPYPITRAGWKDSRIIATELKQTILPNFLYTSPLLRARQTAQAFSNAFRLEAVMDPNLAEQNLGKFSGMSYKQARSLPDYRQDPLKRWDWLPDGGGESYQMVAERVTKFLNRMKDLPDGCSVLIVTHAVVFRVLRGVVEDTLPRYPKKFPNNGEIWKIDFRNFGFQHHIESIMLGNSRRFSHRA